VLIAYTGDQYGSDTLKIPPRGQRRNGVAWYVLLREGKHKYIRTLEEGEIEELYDLKRDPEELTNLALDAKYADRVKRLREGTLAELRRTKAGMAEKLPKAEAQAVEPELRQLVRRQAAILKYVEFRFRPQVRVDEEAVRRAYEAEISGREDAPPLEALAPQLRQRLAERDLSERIEAWVKELRSAADIRYNLPLDERSR
jgi:hypothetical protein